MMNGQTYTDALRSIAAQQADGEDVSARIAQLARAARLDAACVDAAVTEMADLLADA